MTLLILIIYFQALPLFLATLSHIRPQAVFTPQTQPVLAAMILAELTLVFPLFAFAASLHLRLSVYVLLLIPDSPIGR